MTQFELVLKNDKIRQYDRIALLVIILNLFVFIVTATYSDQKQIRVISMAGAAFCLLILFNDYFLRNSKNKPGKDYKKTALFMICLAWLAAGNWWMALACVTLALLYHLSKRQLLVNVNEKLVSYPSFPKREIQWSELNNLILKDGLLTIDFKNNRVLQAEIINSAVVIKEKDFNDFCTTRLNAKSIV